MTRDDVLNYIEEKRDLFIEVNDKIWDFAETRFQEFRSAQLMSCVLEQEGFTIKRGVAGMETAIDASFGDGKPVIGLLAEYDALSGLSQKANVAVKEAIAGQDSGHGCGHNTLGAGCLTTALAIKEYLKQNKGAGTIRFLGCPAEEGGSGKTYMVREGVFDDIDIAITWHPGPATLIFPKSSLANIQAYFRFHGTSSHAAGSPHLGRSALDAVELMNVGANYLREHIIPTARLHYAVTNTGGTAPNVVQAEAEVLYLVRSQTGSEVKEIFERVCDVAKGAALMTGTTHEVVIHRATSNVIPNFPLTELIHQKLVEVGPIGFDDQDRKLAEEFQDSLSDNEKGNVEFMASMLLGDKAKPILDSLAGKALFDLIPPPVNQVVTIPGSTDVGDVSWVVPTVMFYNTTQVMGTPGHSWQYTAQGKSSIAHKGMIHAGKMMALAAIDLFENSTLVEKVKADHLTQLNGAEYVSPIPANIQPSL